MEAANQCVPRQFLRRGGAVRQGGEDGMVGSSSGGRNPRHGAAARTAVNRGARLGLGKRESAEGEREEQLGHGVGGLLVDAGREGGPGMARQGEAPRRHGAPVAGTVATGEVSILRKPPCPISSFLFLSPAALC